jgi:hypothetical protein
MMTSLDSDGSSLLPKLLLCSNLDVGVRLKLVELDGVFGAEDEKLEKERGSGSAGRLQGDKAETGRVRPGRWDAWGERKPDWDKRQGANLLDGRNLLETENFLDLLLFLASLNGTLLLTLQLPPQQT